MFCYTFTMTLIAPVNSVSICSTQMAKYTLLLSKLGFLTSENLMFGFLPNDQGYLNKYSAPSTTTRKYKPFVSFCGIPDLVSNWSFLASFPKKLYTSYSYLYLYLFRARYLFSLNVFVVGYMPIVACYLKWVWHPCLSLCNVETSTWLQKCLELLEVSDCSEKDNSHQYDN